MLRSGKDRSNIGTPGREKETRPQTLNYRLSGKERAIENDGPKRKFCGREKHFYFDASNGFAMSDNLVMPNQRNTASSGWIVRSSANACLYLREMVVSS